MALLLVACTVALGGCGTTLLAPSGGLVGGLINGFSEPKSYVSGTVDLDANGLEAQRPPPLRMYSRPDDPTQPFSPNYGSVPLGAPEPEELPPASV